jgi:hypothetical protein
MKIKFARMSTLSAAADTGTMTDPDSYRDACWRMICVIGWGLCLTFPCMVPYL